MEKPFFTFQFEDSVVRSAVQGSNGVPSTVIPQSLEHPCNRDDRGCPAGGPPLVGHRGSDGGAQTHQAAQESQDLHYRHFEKGELIDL